MSTLLSAIINSPLCVSNIESHKEVILQKLKKLKMNHCCDSESPIESPRVRSKGEWECEIMPFEDEIEYDFSGPFMQSTSVYPHGVRIQTLYNLKTLYLNFNLPWFAKFRNELFQIMQIFEATEIIFLSDGSNILSSFDAQMIDGKTFEETKNNLHNSYGNPMTNYRHLDNKLRSYDSINEWMLDDFADLKNDFNSYADIEPDSFL